ncbi:MAG: CRISPR system precrRNA processing endoribonuclease RAMP protein Cas6 [Melioribacteraceae bacterium]
MNIPYITYSQFNFTIEFLEYAKLPPYKGSMFRGAFGWAFRKAVCVTKEKSCEGCDLHQMCAYFLVFETEIPKNNLWFLKGVKKLSHPFTLHPPLEQRREYNKGDILNVGLTLYGNFIPLLPHFIKTFAAMGNDGIGVDRRKYKLIKVTNSIDSDHSLILFDNTSSPIKKNFIIKSIDMTSDENNVSGITLEFITPARFQKAGKVLTHASSINFELIYNALLRRYFTISRLYCNGNDDDYPSPIDVSGINIKSNNLYFHEMERYSSRQNKKVELGGFMGSISFSGDLAPFISLLKAGEKISIGKNTVFGLGKYKMEINQ